MGPNEIVLVVLLAALTLYGILGGADFGAGIWEFTTALQANEKERRHIYKAIGPVWEANHVWLIFVIVILITAYPLVLAMLSRALWLPLLLALCGIFFRGASYIFRAYGGGERSEQIIWEALFAVASTGTPFFLGASFGALASGKLSISLQGEYQGDYLSDWISLLSIFCGFFSVGICAYLSAVYLYREAEQDGEKQLTQIWRQRSLLTGTLMGLFSTGGLFLVWYEAPILADGFLQRGWPMVILSLVCGMGSLIEVWRQKPLRAVIAAGGAVATVFIGWGLSHYPMLIPPNISSLDVKAPDNVLWMMLSVIGVGAVFLLPALGYLFVLFKTEQKKAG